MQFIKDLWIVFSTGEVIFDYVSETNMDPYIFGGMVSALHSYSERLLDGCLDCFEYGDNCFQLMMVRDLLFVVNCPRTLDEGLITQNLKRIAQKFFKTYTEQVIKQYNLNPNKFSNFEEHIKEYIIK